MSCEYTHDISNPRFADIDGDSWECPHQSVSGSARCVFHSEPGGPADVEPAEQIRDLVANSRGVVRLLGAKFESLSLAYSVLDGPTNHPIDLREATIIGEISFTEGMIKRPLWMDGASVGSISFERAVVDRGVSLQDVEFTQRVTVRLADFNGWVDISDCEFQGHVRGRNAEFNHGVVAENAEFHQAADFLNAEFGEAANFYNAEFAYGAVFNSATFIGDARFDAATLKCPTKKLRGKSGNAIVTQAPGTLDEVALTMRGVLFRKDLKIEDTELTGDIILTDSEIAHEIQTAGITANESVINCQGTVGISGTIDSDDGTITYDFSNATLGDVAFTDGSTIEDLQFDSTRFDGFDFGRHNSVLADRNWRLHTEDDKTSYADIENLYLRAKNGANNVGETRAAGEFLIKEMIYRRRDHQQRLFQSADVRTKVRSAVRWLGNTALGATCGYGERPFRPVVFSGGIIIVYALAYAITTPDIAYSQPLGYVLFSAEAFVSLIVGLPEATSPVVSLLVITEAFIGGFAIALFVFTLTRSVSR